MHFLFYITFVIRKTRLSTKQISLFTCPSPFPLSIQRRDVVFRVSSNTTTGASSIRRKLNRTVRNNWRSQLCRKASSRSFLYQFLFFLSLCTCTLCVCVCVCVSVCILSLPPMLYILELSLSLARSPLIRVRYLCFLRCI